MATGLTTDQLDLVPAGTPASDLLLQVRDKQRGKDFRLPVTQLEAADNRAILLSGTTPGAPVTGFVEFLKDSAGLLFGETGYPVRLFYENNAVKFSFANGNSIAFQQDSGQTRAQILLDGNTLEVDANGRLLVNGQAVGAGSTFLTGTYTAPAPGAQSITVPDAVVFAAVGVEGPGGGLNPLSYGSGYTQSGNVLTVLAAANVQANEIIHYSYLAGSAAAGYTDAQARAAQLNRTAPSGTTTITLDAEAPADYGTAASGTFTVDATGCVVGKVVRFALSTGAGAPSFTNAPNAQPFRFIGPAYAAGKAFSYSLLVCVDRIEVVVLAE